MHAYTFVITSRYVRGATHRESAVLKVHKRRHWYEFHAMTGQGCTSLPMAAVVRFS